MDFFTNDSLVIFIIIKYVRRRNNLENLSAVGGNLKIKVVTLDQMDKVVKPDITKLPLKNKIMDKIIMKSASSKTEKPEKTSRFIELYNKYKDLPASQQFKFDEYFSSLEGLEQMIQQMAKLETESVNSTVLYNVDEKWQTFLSYDFGNSLTFSGKGRGKEIVQGEPLFEQLENLSQGLATKETLLGLLYIYIAQNRDDIVIDSHNLKSDSFLDDAFETFYLELQQEDNDYNKNKKGAKRREFDSKNFNKMRLKDLASKYISVAEGTTESDIEACLREQNLVTETLAVLDAVIKKNKK